MDDKAKLAKTIAEYERLRKLLRDLDAQTGQVDGRLVEIERELPDDYPDDPQRCFAVETVKEEPPTG